MVSFSFTTCKLNVEEQGRIYMWGGDQYQQDSGEIHFFANKKNYNPPSKILPHDLVHILIFEIKDNMKQFSLVTCSMAYFLFNNNAGVIDVATIVRVVGKSLLKSMYIEA